MWESLNICCLLLNKVLNGFVHSVYDQNPISGLSIFDTNTSSMLLQPQIVEVNTIQTNAKHPGVSETNLQHSGSDSKDCAKKWSARNKKYYERNRARILSKRKQRYQENAEVVKAAARVASKVSYARNPEPKKCAARASKLNYARNHQPKTDTARAALNLIMLETLSQKKTLHVQHLNLTMLETLSQKKTLHVQHLNLTMLETLSQKKTLHVQHLNLTMLETLGQKKTLHVQHLNLTMLETLSQKNTLHV